MLDLDGGGAIALDEFLMGCLRLRGQARAIDATGREARSSGEEMHEFVFCLHVLRVPTFSSQAIGYCNMALLVLRVPFKVGFEGWPKGQPPLLGVPMLTHTQKGMITL